MKIVPHAVASFVVTLSLTLRVHADSDSLSGSQFPSTPDPAASASQSQSISEPPPPSPDSVERDPDAVPLAYEHPTKEPTPEEAAAIKQRKDEDDSQHNWLVRGYEQQLRDRPPINGEKPAPDYYTELSQDKDLAQAAGIPLLDAPDDKPSPTEPRVGDEDPQPTEELRPEPPADSPTAPPPFDVPATNTALLLQPFVIPLASFSDIGLKAPYAMASPISPIAGNGGADADDDDDRLPTKPNDPLLLDRDALDIPGMTAAENDPAQEQDLTLDILPGETAAEAKAHHEQEMQLSLSQDAQQLKQQQDTAMNKPVKKVDPLQPVKARTVYPSDTSEMAPDLAPTRAVVHDPYDILR